ncbi:zinc finger and BTB domain-containing protein 25 [Nelusetta ayraudi]|uniref:zinc finger and BTB domain-containing protein 25 n=1 Tax=Nelusetta ayraudi TaxID=303726 RepID=UPI003F7187AF
MEVSSHSLLLLQQLNVQREFGFLCDCTVAIGNVYFKAHRAVLAAFSNYFKMIFIHQSSECIKIQPTDIQPDVFSYLLHIMYTGSCPKQPVEPSRLQDGIKFLHAYQLCRTPAEGAAPPADAAGDAVRMSNLYGIQISSQLASKDPPSVPKSSSGSCGAPEDGGGRSQGVAAALNVCSVASGDDSDVSARIKQERLEDGEEPRGAGPLSPPPHLLCPRCGERCSSPEGLREHLFSHALDPAHPGEGLDGGGGAEPPGEEQLQEALRQSQALANQLAAELRRSRGGGGGVGVLHSRKRRVACAVCGLRFGHKGALQEHMYAHTGRHQRYGRLCSQLFQGAAHLCQGAVQEPGGGADDDPAPSAAEEAVAHRDAQDNGSSCYSLDSEASSGEGLPVE